MKLAHGGTASFPASPRRGDIPEVIEPVRVARSRNLDTRDVLANAQKQPERIEDGMPLLAGYRSVARRLLDAQTRRLAVLPTYAAVERCIALRLWIDCGLGDERPDDSRLADTLNRRTYNNAGRRLSGNDYQARDPDGPLMFMFMNGAQLLAAPAPRRLAISDLGPLNGLSTARNAREYGHVFFPQTPSREDAERYLNTACESVVRACSGEHESPDRLLEGCRFPKLKTGT